MVEGVENNVFIFYLFVKYFIGVEVVDFVLFGYGCIWFFWFVGSGVESC